MISLESTPAVDRLDWVLEGLDGRWDDDMDAVEVMAPTFASTVPPSRFVAVMRERASAIAPITVVGLDVEDVSATAQFRTRDGDLWVARVVVEAGAPHRIVQGYAQRSVPDYLTAALPQAFDAGNPSTVDTAGGTALIVFAGVPGSGKSAVAERVGASLNVPVFALDWLLGALSPFGMIHRTDLMKVGEELLTTLAYRELISGRSVIIDTTTEGIEVRSRFNSLANAVGALFVPVVCFCSDPLLHQQRVEGRHRGIPGWYDAGNWDNVRSRLADFADWPGATYIDTTQPLEVCASQVLQASSRTDRVR